MLTNLHLHPRFFPHPGFASARTLAEQLAQRLTDWFRKGWSAACRHAERPDRFVPRY